MRSSAYIPAIDSLRALAVISVIIYHLHGAWLPGGFAGVDVFFVISGYVISRSLVTLPSSGFLGFTGAFYGRRIRRIVPALIVCLLAISVLSALFIPNAWLSDANQRTGRFAFWGLSNFALMDMGDTYFAPRVEFNPYVHTWSLGVEEQFYLVFPAILYCWLRYRDSEVRWRRVASSSVLSAILVVSLGYSAYVTFNAPAIAYYSLPSRFWELAAGAALMQLHVTGGGFGRIGEQDATGPVGGTDRRVSLFRERSGFPVSMGYCSGARQRGRDRSGHAVGANELDPELGSRGLGRQDLLFAVPVALAGVCSVPMDCRARFVGNARDSSGCDFCTRLGFLHVGRKSISKGDFRPQSGATLDCCGRTVLCAGGVARGSTD